MSDDCRPQAFASRTAAERVKTWGSRTEAFLKPFLTLCFSGLLVVGALAGARPALGEDASAEPLTLRRAAQMALAHAPEVAVSRAGADEAAAAARQARAELKPQAFATTTPGYSSGLPVQVAGQVPSVFGFELRQTVYDPVRRARTFDAAAAASAARGSFERVSTATARAVAMSYGRVWA